MPPSNKCKVGGFNCFSLRVICVRHHLFDLLNVLVLLCVASLCLACIALPCFSTSLAGASQLGLAWLDLTWLGRGMVFFKLDLMADSKKDIPTGIMDKKKPCT